MDGWMPPPIYLFIHSFGSSRKWEPIHRPYLRQLASPVCSFDRNPSTHRACTPYRRKINALGSSLPVPNSAYRKQGTERMRLTSIDAMWMILCHELEIYGMCHDPPSFCVSAFVSLSALRFSSLQCLSHYQQR